MLDKEAFRSYDIRGTYPKQVNEGLAYGVGRALVRHLKVKEIVVGKDARASGNKLFRALAKGINEEGCDVVYIGMCTTPLLNFAVVTGNFKAGVMISASHNPGEYNGFKVIKEGALQMHTKELQKIREIADGLGEAPAGGGCGKGKITEGDFLKEYLRHVQKFAKGTGKMRVVVDYGNGVASLTAKPLFEKLGLEIVALYEEPLPNFPNHEPNPHDLKNMDELRGSVVREKADLGLFFDGDGDRVAVVDEKGEIVEADLLVGVLAKEELAEGKKGKVYYDLRFSRAVGDAISEQGGQPVMMRVGNPFYKERLREEGGVLAGEFSGHIMFPENFNMDDGLFAAVKTMAAMAKHGKKISELIAPLRKYYATEEINLKVGDAKEVMAAVEAAFPEGKPREIDGLYLKFEWGWISVRISRTEPLVRVRLEADSAEKRKEIREKVLGIISKTGE